MALLELIEGAQALEYRLVDKETLIGRHPDCHLMIPSNTVSSHHVKIVKQDLCCQLEDLGSLNGTWVNDQPTLRPVKLQHGDRIRLGDILLRFDQENPLNIRFTGNDDDRTTITAVARGNLEFDRSHKTQAEAKLKAILDISLSLAGKVDLHSLLPTILDTLMHIFSHADRACILLKDEVSGEMVSRAIRQRDPGQDKNILLSRTILNKVLSEKIGILSADALTDSRFDDNRTIVDLSIRSMMCVPMLGLNGEPLGIINIDSQNPAALFTPDELELLMAVAGQAALSYENTRLAVSYVEKKNQDNELAIARNVQRNLLPTEFPDATGYSFFASYDSAQAVGGDYYDCFAIGKDSICITVGDVAGKGVPGALIMTWLSSCVQSTLRFVNQADLAANAINEQMCSHIAEGRFVTFVLLIIDLRTHEMSLVTAGHMLPLIRTVDGTMVMLDEELAGPPFGVVEDYKYQVEKRCVDPGDSIVIVTDGVYEARNPQGDFYGMGRVCDFVKRSSPRFDELGHSLLADVRKYANGQPLNDDVTILTVERSLQRP